MPALKLTGGDAFGTFTLMDLLPYFLLVYLNGKKPTWISDGTDPRS
jgi:hypothetical protein